MFGFMYLPKIKLPIQKAIFTRHITKVSGEDKLIICCFALAQQLALTFGCLKELMMCLHW
jgi:hypothetical protein